MISDFTIAQAPITAYKLVIFNRYNKPGVLVQLCLYVHTNDAVYQYDGIKQFSDYLSERLDELPKEKWNLIGVMAVVRELFAEVSFSDAMRRW